MTAVEPSANRDPARVAVGAEGHRRGRGDIPANIIDATRKNFLHYGVNRTTMADIARAVGMPRQTLYEFIASRDDLVDAVLVVRIKEIAEDIKPLGVEAVSFEEALVETSAAAVERARSDPELMNIFTTGPVDRVQDVVTGSYPEIHAIVAALLGPILDRGAESGLLRADKSRDQLVDWIRVVYLLLINQPKESPGRVRELIADFLLPSIMFSKNEKRAI
jgi:AcrR family transcriptional regulator